MLSASIARIDFLQHASTRSYFSQLLPETLWSFFLSLNLSLARQFCRLSIDRLLQDAGLSAARGTFVLGWNSQLLAELEC